MSDGKAGRAPLRAKMFGASKARKVLPEAPYGRSLTALDQTSELEPHPATGRTTPIVPRRHARHLTRWCRAWVLGIAASIATGVFAQALSITDSGTPSYRLPISVPPGVAGLIPSIALVHNASGSDGPVGHGWSLEGVSVITRCPNIKAVDGTTLTGLINSVNDKLCLDGQRLIQTFDSGAERPFPQSGDSQGLSSGYREYRTEKDSFARIRAYGLVANNAANGPAYFKVWTKSGRIQEYGTATNASANATIKAQGKDVVVTWALSRVSDSKGNYIDFLYDQRDVAWGSGSVSGQPLAGREWNLTEIRYTGTTTSAPSNRVGFVYEDRAAAPAPGKAQERAEIYHLGSKVVKVRRLAKVQTFVNAAASTPIKVRTFQLTYDTGPVSSRSRLRQVAECAGASETPCLPPTTFEYSAGSNEAYSANAAFGGSSLSSLVMHTPLQTTSFVPGPGTSRSVITADFNGDGRTDILRWGANPAENQLYFSAGDGSFAVASAFNINENLYKSNGCYSSHVGDFNGDGLPDIFRFKAPTGYETSGFVTCTGTTDLYLNQGNGSFQRVTVSGLPSTMSPKLSLNTCGDPPPGDPCGDFEGWTRGETFYVLDINGDGKLDVMVAQLPQHQPEAASVPPPSNPCASIVCTRVFIGDGQGAFVEKTPIGVANRVLYSPPQGALALGQPSHVVDVDGNGLNDLAGVGAFGLDVGNSNWRSRGDGEFDEQVFISSNTSTGLCAVPIDFNGDGRPDCLSTTAALGAETASLHVSDGWDKSIRVADFNLGAAGALLNTDVANDRLISGVTVHDFNGDGRADLLRWHNDPAQNVLYLSNGDGTFRASSTFNLTTATSSLRTGDNNVAFLVGDFTGHGDAEIIRLHSSAASGGASSNLLLVKSSAAQPADQLLAVVSPTGLRTTLTWVSLANPASGSLGSRYATDRSLPGATNPNAAVYPQYDFLAPTHVVATMTADSGVGSSQIVTEYSYAGLKRAHDGRGVLGFREVRRQGPAPDGSNLTIFSKFNQKHPYTGTVKQVETRLGRLNEPSSLRLSLTTSVYCEQSADGAARAAATMDLPCVATPKVQRPYRMSSTESAWDLGGLALPVTTTTTAVNETGDPAQTIVTKLGSAFGLTQTFTRTTTNTFKVDNTACTNDTTCAWVLGRVDRTTQQSTVPDSFGSIAASAGSAPNATATAGTASNQAGTISNIVFGNVSLGSPSIRAATLTSKGLVPLAITAPTAASVSGTDFTYESTTCGSTLAPGASCTVSVKLTPTAPVARTGTLTVATGAGNLLSGLSGSGVGSAASVQSNAAFGTNAYGATIANQSVTVKNLGNAAMTLTISGYSSPFSLVSNGCSNVAPNATCGITFAMSNTKIGAASQTISLSGGSTGAATATVTGTITGSRATLVAGDLAFSAAALNSSAPSKTLSLRNDGNAVMTLTGLSGLSAPFSVASNTCSGIAAGATCSIVVSMATSTIGNWSQAASSSGATVNTSLPASGTVTGSIATVTAGDLGFGGATLDASAPSRTLTVRNDGNASMTLAGLAGLGAPFNVSGNSCGSVTPGASCSMTVSMATSSNGSWSQSVVTSGAAVNASAAASGSVSGSIATFIGDSGPALNFGAVGQGGAAPTRSWAFRNDGNVPMSLGLSPLNSPFTVTNYCGGTVSPGNTCSIVAQMGTGAAGSFSQSGIAASGAARGNRSDFSLSGTVNPSTTTASASPTTLSWSSVPKGSTTTRTLTLTNTGSAAATGLGYAVSYTSTSSLGDHYRIGGTCPAAGGSLAAGASCSVVMAFAANCTGGTRNGTLNITGNFSLLAIPLNTTITSSGSCL